MLWWYCLPILVPLLLVAIRVDAFRNFRWPYVAVTSAIVVAIVLGNRWYVRAKLVPRRASVEHLLNELEDARA